MRRIFDFCVMGGGGELAYGNGIQSDEISLCTLRRARDSTLPSVFISCPYKTHWHHFARMFYSTSKSAYIILIRLLHFAPIRLKVDVMIQEIIVYRKMGMESQCIVSIAKVS